jgi:very-short-patch-repair endonuclease
MEIISSNLENTFRAIRSKNPDFIKNQNVQGIPRQNHSPISSVSGFMATANTTLYGQPTFFSPIHTNINWQIPQKRMEMYQWARFFYDSEPKVAGAIDFYSEFPMNNWTHECRDPKVKLYFDDFKKRLNLHKWTKLISHEMHLLGDCFPFLEVHCDKCGGTGRHGDQVCDHEGGTIKRIVILNPDYVDVISSPLDPDPVIVLRPDEELKSLVLNKRNGHQKISQRVAQLIMSGQPIQLDSRFVSHLKYGESGYSKYGTGMVKRLFPILSYKTKLMMAQWTVAERLIVPIKLAKVGSNDRPAGPVDIASVQEMLHGVSQEPNVTLVTYHDFDLTFVGASGQVLQLSTEFEFINQEIFDGLMINKALLGGEGPTFQSAAVGIEAMISRMESFRYEVAEWIEEKIYKPEAIRQGFFKRDKDTGLNRPVYPKIKFNSLNLRDQQQWRRDVLDLYKEGLLSGAAVLEVFGFNPDHEMERKRYDNIQMLSVGQGMLDGSGAPVGGGGGGGGMGGGGDMGMPDMSNAGVPPGMDMGGGDAGAPVSPGGEAPMQSTTSSTISAAQEIANPQNFGGKVLKRDTREKLITRNEKQNATQNVSNSTQGGNVRDEKGRIVFTKPERQLMEKLQEYLEQGIIKYPIKPQLEVNVGNHNYLIDFAIPHLKLGIEADGIMFHSNPDQKQHDQERDMRLAQKGWTIVRFTDEDIDEHMGQVLSKITQAIMKKEMFIKNQAPNKG